MITATKEPSARRKKHKAAPGEWDRYTRPRQVAIYDGSRLVRVTSSAAFACHFPLGGMRVVVLG